MWLAWPWAGSRGGVRSVFIFTWHKNMQDANGLVSSQDSMKFTPTIMNKCQ